MPSKLSEPPEYLFTVGFSSDSDLYPPDVQEGLANWLVDRWEANRIRITGCGNRVEWAVAAEDED